MFKCSPVKKDFYCLIKNRIIASLYCSNVEGPPSKSSKFLMFDSGKVL